MRAARSAQAKARLPHAAPAPPRPARPMGLNPAPVAPLWAIPANLPSNGVGREAKERPPIQPRLEVGPAGDRYEREADGIAGRVMALREPAVPSAVPGHQSPGLASTGPQHSPVGDPGRRLPGETRTFFERRLGRDLSRVRLHQGRSADRLGRALHARAFTIGSDIWLRSGERTTPSFTLAHELAHVVQQSSPGPLGPAGGQATGVSPRIQRREPPDAEPSIQAESTPKVDDYRLDMRVDTRQLPDGTYEHVYHEQGYARIGGDDVSWDLTGREITATEESPYDLRGSLNPVIDRTLYHMFRPTSTAGVRAQGPLHLWSGPEVDDALRASLESGERSGYMIKYIEGQPTPQHLQANEAHRAWIKAEVERIAAEENLSKGQAKKRVGNRLPEDVRNRIWGPPNAEAARNAALSGSPVYSHGEAGPGTLQREYELPAVKVGAGIRGGLAALSGVLTIRQGLHEENPVVASVEVASGTTEIGGTAIWIRGALVGSGGAMAYGGTLMTLGGGVGAAAIFGSQVPRDIQRGDYLSAGVNLLGAAGGVLMVLSIFASASAAPVLLAAGATLAIGAGLFHLGRWGLNKMGWL
jgi:Domain of unknown function (DUF4157)